MVPGLEPVFFAFFFGGLNCNFSKRFNHKITKSLFLARRELEKEEQIAEKAYAF